MNRILAVDDNPDVVRLVQRILGGAGYEVIGAASGKEALEILYEIKPDLVLLDIMMPGWDGWETLRQIRERDNLKDVPVSMLTAKALTPETAQRDDIEEIIDYIQKPFTKERLIKKVDSIFHGLEIISKEKAELKSDVNLKRLEELNKMLKAEMLHKSILVVLKHNLKNAPDAFEKEILVEAIFKQETKLNELWIQIQEIEKEIVKTHIFSPADVRDKTKSKGTSY